MRYSFFFAWGLFWIGACAAQNPEEQLPVRDERIAYHADRSSDDAHRKGLKTKDRLALELPLLRRRLREYIARDGEWSLSAARIYRRLAERSNLLGDKKQAQTWMAKSHEIFLALSGSEDRETIQVKSELAELLRRRGYVGRAEPRLLEAWHQSQALRGPWDESNLPSRQARVAERKAMAAAKRGKLSMACSLYQRALKEWLPLLGPDHPRVLRVRWCLARLQKHMADPHRAKSFQEFWRRCLRLENLRNYRTLD